MSDAVRANPYPAYEQLRRAGRAVFDPAAEVWYVGHYEDARTVLRTSDVFSNRQSGPEPTLQGADGALHRRARKLVQPAFTPERIGALAPRLQALADDVVGRLSGRDTCEFMSEVAMVLPATALTWMLGLPMPAPLEVRRQVDGIILSAAERLELRLRGSGPDGEAPAWPGLAESEAYLRRVLDHAAGEETGGWIADLLAPAYRQGELTVEQFIDIGLLLMVGATETTSALTGACARVLAEDPALQQHLREQPQLLDAFVDEVLRLEAPVQRRRRVVVQDTHIGGCALPEGTTVVVLIGAANRDPGEFPAPDTVRLDRPYNRHLSFGGGPHICPGAQLGRMEARAVLAAMLRELPPFRLLHPQAPVEQSPTLTLRGPRRLPITWAPAD